jgi:hypothetical protein
MASRILANMYGYFNSLDHEDQTWLMVNIGTARSHALAHFETMSLNSRVWFEDNYKSIQNGFGPLKPEGKKSANLAEAQSLYEALTPEDQEWMMYYIHTVRAYALARFESLTTEDQKWFVDNYKSIQNCLGPLEPKPKAKKPTKKPAAPCA